MAPKSPNLLGRIATYTEILAKDPHSTVFVALADTYRQLGLLDDASDIALKGTAEMPNFSPGFAVLGRIYFQRKELGNAAMAFERALAIEKDSLPALKGLARIRHSQGYKEQAAELLKRALVVDPEDATALKLLDSLDTAGTVRGTSGPGSQRVMSPASADSHPAEKRTHVNPATPIATETMADLYLSQGLFAEAAEIYRALLQQRPDDEKLREKLLQVKSRLDGQQTQEDALSGDAGESRPDEQKASSGSLEIQLQSWLKSIVQRRDHVSASLANRR